ncbi:MAG TPA: TetR/AcrR family transcriptional regulator [Gemmatimonadaceae bacterium]|jgi:AcrR family transcriptional regulator|nr:TetR/AcrR family transcriptional regulator [Gemmatimonadaceae bacterium]
MARPKSDDKRDAILTAAAEVFADRGLDAPTSAISRAAGVAEGTLFTYFATKDDLVNALYRAIKVELGHAMMSDLPRQKDGRSVLRHIFNGYVGWGVSNPEKRKALTQLQVSDRVTVESQRIGYAPFAGFETIVRESIAQREIRDLPLPFIGAAMGALGDMTMKFMAEHPAAAARYRKAGFEVFWNGIAAE